MTSAFRFSDLLSQVGETSDDENDLSIPPDDYTVVVEEAEAVIANSGNPMIKVKFVVQGGPYDGKWVLNNFVLAINSTKGKDALKPFFRQMKAFGLDDEFFNALGDQGLEAVAPRLVGKTVTIKTARRQWDGKTYTDVKGVSKYSGTPGAPSVPALSPSPTVPAVPATPPAVPAQAAPATPGPPAAPPPPPF